MLETKLLIVFNGILQGSKPPSSILRLTSYLSIINHTNFVVKCLHDPTFHLLATSQWVFFRIPVPPATNNSSISENCTALDYFIILTHGSYVSMWLFIQLFHHQLLVNCYSNDDNFVKGQHYKIFCVQFYLKSALSVFSTTILHLGKYLDVMDNKFFHYLKIFPISLPSF